DRAGRRREHRDRRGARPHRPAALPHPAALTSRARGVLERGRGLLNRLRDLAGTFEGREDAGPLRELYEDTVPMIDTPVRPVAPLPDSPGAPPQFCRGLEVTRTEVEARLRALLSGGEQLRRQHEDVFSLAEVLSALHGGQPVDFRILHGLTERVLTEVDE